jgi:N-acetylneuraminate synthase/sialic acid synthase
VAYALGARIIEHHFTTNRAGKGTDQAFSLEPKGLSTLVDDLEKIRLALGDGVKRYYSSERGPIAKMRRRPTADGWQITGALDAPDDDSSR